MARQEKLIAKLRQKSSDFTWGDLVSLLKGLGYKQVKPGKTAGSRRRFLHPDHGFISLHQPHPGNLLKKYQLIQIIEVFEQEGLI
ncbi:MAG: addiction module toxin, HicA family [Candidatus Latescibacteria bacterium]|nr:addiction module toxin, HicA family [Candidatus Latescibacterota bacterium]